MKYLKHTVTDVAIIFLWKNLNCIIIFIFYKFYMGQASYAK